MRSGRTRMRRLEANVRKTRIEFGQTSCSVYEAFFHFASLLKKGDCCTSLDHGL